jgi:thiosulfate/3-mercaptopyruvate sulfurtransferase
MFSCPRAAWMLRYFGAYNVKILNGGMKKWIAEGKEIVLGP